MRVLVVDPGQRHEAREREPEGPLSFSFSKDLPAPGGYDLLVLPASLLLDGPADLRRELPLIAYGPVDLLADSIAEGCDDYMREPWRLDELEARALRFWRLRFRLGTAAFEYSSGRLEGAAGSVSLPPGERAVLELLLHRLSRAIPREAFAQARGVRGKPKSRLLDMTVSRLRARLAFVSGESGAESFLVAIRNYGYRLDGTPCA